MSPSLKRDTGLPWIALVCILAAVLAALNLLAGCAPQRVVCPGWAAPNHVNTDAATSGQVGANAAVLTQSGSATGKWAGATSVDYTCKDPCDKGSLLRWARTKDSETLECLPATGAAGTTTKPASGPAEPRDGR